MDILKRQEERNRQSLISSVLFGVCLIGATGAWASDWQYAEGSLTALNGISQGMVLSVASAGDAKLTVTAVTDWNGKTDVDLSGSITDGVSDYTVTSLGKAFKGTAITSMVLPTGLTELKDAFTGCSSLKHVTPFLPETLTSYTASFAGCSVLTQEVMRISNPAMTTCPDFGENAWVGTVDERGSGITAGGYFRYRPSITNVIFSSVLTTMNSKYMFYNEAFKNLALRFTGGVPSWTASGTINGKTFAVIYIPRWNAVWEAAIDAQTEVTTNAISAANYTSFEGRYPGERVADFQITVGTSGSRVCGYIYPDEPPYGRELDLTDVVYYDGCRPVVGTTDDADGALAWNLFDGSRKTPTASKRWLVADGSSATYELPPEAKTARALKVTGYTLSMLVKNGKNDALYDLRAPTAWTLEAKTATSGWQTIDTVDFEMDPTLSWTTSDFVRELPEEKQSPYVAFRFTPTKSRSKAAGGDETPFGLQELSFSGVRMTKDPTLGEVGLAKREWSALTVSATLLKKGEDASKEQQSEYAGGWVELSDTEDFATIAARSAEEELLENVPTDFRVAGLVGATGYYARLVVTNDLGGAVTSVLGAVSTLDTPFEIGKVVATPDEAGNVFVTVEVKALECPTVQLEAYSGRSPTSQEDLKGSKTVTGSGTVEFPEFASPAMPAWVMIRAYGMDGDKTYFSTNVVSIGTFWYANSTTSPSVISNANDGMVVNVSAFQDGLRAVSVARMNGVTHVNLRAPIYDADGGVWLLRSMSDMLRARMEVETVELPDEMKIIDASAFANMNTLTTLHLPAGLESIGSSACANLSKLKTVFPLLPESLTNVGESCFCYCSVLTGDVRLVSRKLEGVLPYQLFRGTKVTSLDLSGSSFTSISQWAFDGTTLTNVVLGTCVSDLNSRAFQSQPSIRKVTVKGDVFEGLGAAFQTYIDSLGLLYEVNYTEATRDYLRTNCTVVALTAKERAAYAAAYPGERPCRRKVKMPSTAGKWRYLIFSNGPGFLLIVK